jgi:hypothetical protein
MRRINKFLDRSILEKINSDDGIQKKKRQEKAIGNDL